MVIEKFHKTVFDACVRDAIVLGRKHMNTSWIEESDMRPTKEEWNLALVLFKLRCQEK